MMYHICLFEYEYCMYIIKEGPAAGRLQKYTTLKYIMTLIIFIISYY